MNFLPPNTQLILASGSPRRQELLKALGYDFKVRLAPVNEDYDDTLQGSEIAEYLADKKASAQKNIWGPNEIVLASDTVVWCNGESLAKAKDAQAAVSMLNKLSGRSHQVITGVCLLSVWHKELFSCTTVVKFKPLTEEEISYYVEKCQPFDKAGAYGIQEWIGMRAIESIEGSYFNVVGLPTHLIPAKLASFERPVSG